MKKLIFATVMIAFIAGLMFGWTFLPQPQLLFDAYGHLILLK